MRQLSERGFEEVAQQFRLLGDARRLKILDLLRRHPELPVGEVAERIGCSPAHASRQLARLHRADLLSRRQDGAVVYYAMASPWVFSLCQSVCGHLEAGAQRAEEQPLFVEPGADAGDDKP